MNYNYIKKDSELSKYLSLLEEKKTSIVAMDLEAELNRHAYGETLCLVQIFDGTEKILIDPFKVDIELLKSFFENRNILKVVYDASSDLSFLWNAYSTEIKSILDLRPAVALLNLEKQDLHSVLASELGVCLENKEKFQRQDWTKRPISAEAIDYALSDVTYLFKLKDVLLKKLFEKQLMDSYILNNLKVQNKDYTRNPEDKYNRLFGYQKLPDAEKVIVQEVGKIIEKYASQYNIPAHWVINKNDIITIVKDPDYLSKIRVPSRFSQESAQGLLSELRIASQALKTNPPFRERAV